MEFIKTLKQDLFQANIKALLIKSLRVGLFAFIVSFFLALSISLVINILFLTNVNEIVQGAIGTSDQLTISGVIKTASFIMNISVFNRLEELKFGILIFALIPFLSFYFADRKDNKEEGISIEHIFVYTVSATVFAMLSMVEAYLSKGELIGLQIDFYTIGNFFSTLIIGFAIQLIIGLNYNSHGLTGITSAKRLTWILLGTGAVASVIGMLYLLKDFTVPFLLKIVGIIILLPNVAVYAMFTFMGTTIGLGESLVSALSLAEINTAFGALPAWVKMISLLIYTIGIFVALLGINKEKYMKHLIMFAVSFATVTFFAAYSTTINLGTVVILKDVFVGVSLLRAFLIPLISIMVFGVLLKLIRDIIIVFKES